MVAVATTTKRSFATTDDLPDARTLRLGRRTDVTTARPRMGTATSAAHPAAECTTRLSSKAAGGPIKIAWGAKAKAAPLKTEIEKCDGAASAVTAIFEKYHD